MSRTCPSSRLTTGENPWAKRPSTHSRSKRNRTGRRGGHRTKPGSKPIVQTGLPTLRSPESPRSGQPTVRSPPDVSSRGGFHVPSSDRVVDRSAHTCTPGRSTSVASGTRDAWSSSRLSRNGGRRAGRPGAKSVSAGRRGSGLPGGGRSGGRLVAPEFEQVVGGGDQPPFGAAGGSAAALEVSGMAVVLDVREDRFDHRLALLVEGAAGVRL